MDSNPIPKDIRTISKSAMNELATLRNPPAIVKEVVISLFTIIVPSDKHTKKLIKNGKSDELWS